jgi:hypothetical protein
MEDIMKNEDSNMKSNISLGSRRLWVIINYTAVLLLLAVFYAAERGGLSASFIIFGAITLIIVLISFIKLHLRTRLWKMVHSGTDVLDEREIQVTREALRLSYTLFSVITLIIILAYELIRQLTATGLTVPLMPILAVLIYLAHTLPSSIIAWTEKEI